jgi:FRG domain
MNIIEAPKNWDELNSAIWKNSIDEYDNYRPRIAYRGLSQNYGNLKTSIQRIGGSTIYDRSELDWRERRIIETFSTYSINELPTEFSDWDVILLGQHYGLPTRLLDWTSSPYVALFFATQDTSKFDRDGIIYCVSRVESIDILPRNMKNILSLRKSRIFYLDILKSAFPYGLKQLDDEVEHETMIWFEPPSISPRIINQFAFFSLMPGVDSSQYEWLVKHPDLYWGIPILASLKKEIRQRLQVMNITERTIYQGLEGTARWLSSFYS